jgi:hypothetical protein
VCCLPPGTPLPGPTTDISAGDGGTNIRDPDGGITTPGYVPDGGPRDAGPDAGDGG